MISMKIGAWNAAPFLWAQWSFTCSCTVKPYDIVKVKNALLKSVYCSTKCTIYSLGFLLLSVLQMKVHIRT